MASEANAALITRFYTAFTALNGDDMAACYAPNATFKDPAFDLKNGNEAGSMWKMLTGRSKEFKLVFSNVKGTETGGSADWVANYLYQKNPVENGIHSEFKIENGLIVEQVDTFDFHKWASQALGTPGWLFGWLPFFHNTVRGKAMDQLKKYMAKNSTSAAS
jgi:hypothetical protein